MSGQARAAAANDALYPKPYSLDRVLSEMLAFETDDMRWLRERSERIAQAHAEMLAERAADDRAYVEQCEREEFNP